MPSAAKINLASYEVWFVTGSQHLYGDAILKVVAQHASTIAKTISASKDVPVKVVCKPVMTNPDEIYDVCQQASVAPKCVGVILWMHTFSPSKMWIAGLKALQRPFLHLDTQFNRDVPWPTIDMDFMNLNQSAHGDREFGFICTRLGLERKVVVGHYEESNVHAQIGTWARAACAWRDTQGARFARFGDNMRQVAVTEGNKVSAQIDFGYQVNGWGVGDLAAFVGKVRDSAIDKLVRTYEEQYEIARDLKSGGERHASVREAARIEIGLRAFLEEGGFKGFTTTFEDLHGLRQLPGLAVQRLMADGYGFAAEGDWKTAALVRAVKVMGEGLPGGTSFMEDYTYHFNPKRPQVLGAHMLEICPSIAKGKAKLDVQPLGIGGKEDPARLIFDVEPGEAMIASVIDLGDRFRLIVNELTVHAPAEPLPKLPVARVLWHTKPDIATATAAWIHAGGAHHEAFSKAVTSEHIRDYAEMAGVELLVIGDGTKLCDFKNQIRWNKAYYSGKC